MFFKAATLKTPENQTNYKQLQNTKTIESKESQNRINKKEDISKTTNKNIAIVRLLDSSCNSQKTIAADNHKNGKPNGEKNEKSIFVIGDSMVKHPDG